MKILFDYFPIVLFFITYKVYDIYAATAIAIAASVLQVAYLLVRRRKVETTHWLTLFLIVIFGGLTLFLQDEQFIKWKPTVINWLFGIAFLGSHFVGKKTFVERMMNQAVELPEMIWRRLNLMWALFFVVLGGVNWFVFRNFDTDTWVHFKLFGMLGLTLLFVFIQALYLSRHVIEQDSEE